MNLNKIEVFCFGCIGQPGHFLHSKSKIEWNMNTPWGDKLDGGLLTQDYYGAAKVVDGRCVVAKKDGWIAISFWDSSGDSRGGSNTSFLAKDSNLTPEGLLLLAKEQWPEVFHRPGFPKLVSYRMDIPLTL